MKVPQLKPFVWNPRLIAYGIGIGVGILILSVIMHRIVVLDEDPSWRTFALVHFSGYLFFIISPVELLFVHMPDLRADMGPLIGIAVGTALLAQAIDYGIGYAFSDTVIKGLIGERRYRRYNGRIQRYGDVTVFFFCLFPLSSPIVVVVAGMIQYGFARVLIVGALGLTAKYVALALLFA